jgi:hypothetical protein
LAGKAGFADRLVDERGLGGEVLRLWLWLAGSGAAIVLAALWARTRRVLTVAACAFGLTWIGYGLVGYPVLDASSSARAVMQRARAAAGPDTEIGLVAWKEQNLLQAIGPVTEFGFRQPAQVQLARGAQWLSENPQGRILMVNQVEALDCIAFGGPDTVHLEKSNRRSWWLVKPGALAGCQGLAP